MTDTSAAFKPAFEALAWAHDAIEEFAAEARSFFSSGAIAVVNDFDEDQNEMVQRVILEGELPDKLRRKATEALNNTRHAFDQATFATKRALNSKDQKSVYFPWSKTPVDLRKLLEARGIDQRLWADFESTPPYPKQPDGSGNDLLRGVAQLANEKHTFGLTVFAHIEMTRFPNISGTNLEHFSVLSPMWNDQTNSADLIRWRGNMNVQGDYIFDFMILFSDYRLPSKVSVASTLQKFYQAGFDLATRLKERCIALIDA